MMATVFSTCIYMLMLWFKWLLHIKNSYKQLLANQQPMRTMTWSLTNKTTAPPLTNYRETFNNAYWIKTTRLVLSHFSHFLRNYNGNGKETFTLMENKPHSCMYMKMRVPDEVNDETINTIQQLITQPDIVWTQLLKTYFKYGNSRISVTW